MKSEDVIVTCLNCKKSAHIKIMNGNQVMYVDHTPIIACRYRPDMIWGFECICGNDSRLSPQEVPQADVLVSGAGQGIIDKVIASTKVKAENKFTMRAA